MLLYEPLSILICIPINNYPKKHAHYIMRSLGRFILSKAFIRSKNWEHSCNHIAIWYKGWIL